MPSTANLLTDDQLSERLTKVGEGLPEAAAVMVVEWRNRAEALRRAANAFLVFIVVALFAGMVFVWAADFLIRQSITQGIKAAGMAEIDLISERKDTALKQLKKAAANLGS